MCQGYKIWHGSICKGYMEFWIYRNMGQYTPIMPEYALISFSVSDHGWKMLKGLEYAQKCINKLLWLCQGTKCALSSYIFDRIFHMPSYSYNNIVIIASAIILELLYPCFVHSGAPQLII